MSFFKRVIGQRRSYIHGCVAIASGHRNHPRASRTVALLDNGVILELNPETERWEVSRRTSWRIATIHEGRKEIRGNFILKTWNNVYEE